MALLVGFRAAEITWSTCFGRFRTCPRPAAPRLEAAQTRNREIAEENQRLRAQLAHALGQLRAAGLLIQEPEPLPTQPRRRSSVTIGPC
ncbi:hypothetical protein [Spongiactinospora rosea]|uniref:hypothetical protein n=1 Tax=Spongiactinospora rosea TaxID=2248750 RepID=UPI0018F4522C|nr:hypothetical protein [Spongiactinospora rosea]